MKPTIIGFEQRFADDSGVQFGVYLDGGKRIKFSACGDGEAEFPIDQLEWLMTALDFIADSLPEKP